MPLGSHSQTHDLTLRYRKKKEQRESDDCCIVEGYNTKFYLDEGKMILMRDHDDKAGVRLMQLFECF